MSSVNKKILFLVEGADVETKIATNLAKKMFMLTKEKYTICAYGTSIYELFEELEKDPYLSAVDILIEKGQISLPDGATSKSAFSQIYLFFDYEPNYQKYSDESIRKCLEMFNNETENGKLYINYPMVESIFYLDDFKSPKYIAVQKDLKDCNSRGFKKETKQITCYRHKNNVDFNLWDVNHILNAIKWTYIIYCKICSKDIRDFKQEIDYLELLNLQIDLKNVLGKIFIIGTLILLIVDYNPDILLEIDEEIFIK